MSNSGALSLDRQTVLTAVADQIRTLILTRRLKPGERLIQNDLAVQLGVSRTPVREALQLLASEGLVTISPYRGASVTEFALNDLEGIYHVRIALEGYAGRLATRHITDEEVERLRELVAKMKEAFEQHAPDKQLEINRQFYVCLYQATRQQRLYEVVINYLDLSRQYRRIAFYLEDLTINILKEHDEILAAIERRDEDAVEQLLRVGLENTLASLRRSLEV